MTTNKNLKAATKKKKRKEKGFWTKPRCAEEALKYRSRTEFFKASKGSYLAALRNSWLDDICNHMEYRTHLNKKWTKASCAKEAQKFKTLKEFRENSASALNAIYANNWWDEICSHITKSRKPNNYWNKERCLREALKFKTRKTFFKGTSGVKQVLELDKLVS
jgi:hypothetical protein